MITLPGPADVHAVPVSEQRGCSAHAHVSLLSADFIFPSVALHKDTTIITLFQG